MQIVQNGTQYVIYDNSISTHNALPAQNYVVRFSKDQGFFLESYAPIEIKDPKIYGVHHSKVDKIMNSFKLSNRNLGVILSGDKGIGKSLCAKLTAIRAVSEGMPVIIVDKFIPGIASFLEEINQEVMILFDEFDKTFGGVSRTSENSADPQATMLSLFDGVSPGKKLFVITCNNLRNLNEYLTNRPGRFHYHFRFEYPTPSEIRQYMEDSIAPEYYGEIDAVIMFSCKINLNYDCLRSIAFELNQGITFAEAIKDLNILNLNSEKYRLHLCFEDGTYYTANQYLDLFGENKENISFHDREHTIYFNATIDSTLCKFNTQAGAYIISADDAAVVVDKDYTDEDVKEKALAMCPTYIRIMRIRERNIHYAV